MSSDHPVKRLLFDHIRDHSGEISAMIRSKRFDGVIRHLIAGCYDAALDMEDEGESIGVLATGILHYTLTNALVPSQRSVEHRGVPVDIVVPGLKTLDSNPDGALVVYVASTQDIHTILHDVGQLRHVQPKGDNIWAVLHEDAGLEHRTYTVSKGGRPFHDIIHDIAGFVNRRGGGGLRILGA